MTRRPSHALIAAGFLLAFAALVWHAAFHSGYAMWLDGATLHGFMGLAGENTAPLAERIAELGNPTPFAAWSTALVLLALLRGRPRLALAVGILLLGANVTTQVLKDLLAEPRAPGLVPYGQIADASWPSGHTTAAASLAIGLVLIVPPRLRPAAAALGGAFVVGMVYSILMLGWHLPSDALGGFGVAGAWASVVLAGLWAAERRWPAGTGREAAMRLGDAIAPTVAAGAAALGIAVAALALRPDESVAYAQQHTVFVAGAAAIGALALLLAAAFAAALTPGAGAALRGRTPRRRFPPAR